MTAAPLPKDAKKPGANSLLATYQPLFKGEAWSIAWQGVLSFLGGMAEAALLVVVARTAFAIAGDEDTAVPLGPLGTVHLSVSQLIATAAVLAVFRAIFQIGAAHLTSTLISRATASIRAGTYEDYAVASWAVQSEMDEAAVQDLLLRYVARLIGVVQSISTAFATVFALFALLLSAVIVDPLSALLVVGSGALLFVGLRPLSVRAKVYSRRQIDAGRVYMEQSRELIEMSVEVRAFGVSEAVAGKLHEATMAEVRPTYVNQMLQRVVLVLYQTAAISIVLVGLWAVYEFLDRPLASLGAIVIILVRSLNLASALQNTYHSASEVAPFANRLQEERARLRASATKSGDERTPSHAILRFDDVSYRYAPDAPLALDHVSFEVQPGEAVGIIGPSGSGKSTLIQLMLRLREPSEGRYLLGDVDSVDLDDLGWFRTVAFVPQDCRVVNQTVAENIRFFRDDLTDDDVIDAAKRAHVHEEILAMPDGYDTVLGARGGALSGGQRQRVAIARALASRPEILILDEPTSALDMKSEAMVHETLTELQGSVTLLIIAHRLSTLRTCDRIMVFGGGRLQQFGPRADLEANSAFYREATSLSKLRS